jgi:hypothetical protein
VSPQKELSWILPSIAFCSHHLKDLYRVSLERIFMDFALSGFIFSSLRGFIPCLLRENFHGFCPQWLCIFIPQQIFTVSPQRELSRALYFQSMFFKLLYDVQVHDYLFIVEIIPYNLVISLDSGKNSSFNFICLISISLTAH